MTGLALVAAGLGIGRLFVPSALLALRRLTNQIRRLAGEWSGEPIAVPYQPPPGAPGERLSFRQRLFWLLGDPATWRDMLWVTVNAVLGWSDRAGAGRAGRGGPAGVHRPGRGPRTGRRGVHLHGQAWGASIPTPAFPARPHRPLLFGIALVLAGVASAPWLLRAYFGLAGSLLAPTGQAELAQRVSHLAQTRSETLDGGAAEIRRIERDLHDGAQARLVAMGMTLGAAEELIESSPEAARALLAEARESSARALAELRALVRGIHPPVLADRGLADAVRALALDSGLNVEVEARCRAARRRRWSRPRTSPCPNCWPTCPSTRAPGRPGSTCGTSVACCGWTSSTTVTAARMPPGAAACTGSSAGSRPLTGYWP